MTDIWKYIIKFLQCSTEISQCLQEKKYHPMPLRLLRGRDIRGQLKCTQPSAKKKQNFGSGLAGLHSALLRGGRAWASAS